METLALDAIQLDIAPGEFVSIMGPSGCGKSTLLNLIGLLDAPSSGQVALDGAPITSYRDAAVARVRNENIGFIFQSFHLVPDLTVVDNVEIPLLYRRLSNRERRQRALAALERVALSSRVHHFPSQLSGGQQQRVAVARALATNPKLILADEPTANLDTENGKQVMDIMQRLNKETGVTFVFATHDPRVISYAQRVVTLRDGLIVENNGHSPK
jgi:putative ABC transport system ATP-binding protein